MKGGGMRERRDEERMGMEEGEVRENGGGMRMMWRGKSRGGMKWRRMEEGQKASTKSNKNERMGGGVRDGG
jgi:hypothetical protein